jgi:hypothetical protein
MYYDRDGQPLTFEQWIRCGIDKRVALDDLPNGYRVSTVWLGLDHRFGDAGPPLIFESMVFVGDSSTNDDGDDLDCWRYSTEAEARAGHELLVAQWSSRD